VPATELITSSLLMPMKVGSIAKAGRVTMTLDSIEKKVGSLGGHSMPVGGRLARESWSISLSIAGETQGIEVVPVMTNPDGKPILWVDRSGAPVSTSEYEAWAKLKNHGSERRKYFSAIDGASSEAIGNEVHWGVSVDPSKVAQVRLAVSRRKMIEIPRIPLDPR